MDNEIPADKVYKWMIENEVNLDHYKSLMTNVCEEQNIQCNRQAPLLYGPITVSDVDGNNVGVLEIPMFQEPVDAIYSFLAKNGLIEKGWNTRSILDQICEYPELSGKCDRREALIYYNSSFSMGNRIIGGLAIWEGEEVIDKLYQIRLQNNLTLYDQMESFAMICESNIIHCGRSRALIHRVSGINWKEYDDEGDSTCKRYHAGWQYLKFESTLSQKIRNWLENLIDMKDFSDKANNVSFNNFLSNIRLHFVENIDILVYSRN